MQQNSIDLNPTPSRAIGSNWRKLASQILVALTVFGMVGLLVGWRKEAQDGKALQEKLDQLNRGVENRPFTFQSPLDSLQLTSYTVYRFDTERAIWKVETEARAQRWIRNVGDVHLRNRNGQTVRGIYAELQVTDPVSGFQEKFTLCPLVGDSVVYLPFSESFEAAYARYRRRESPY